MFEGDLGPMKAIWSHADDVSYMGPGGGVRRGWGEVLADWEAQAGKHLGGRIAAEILGVTLGGDLAVVQHRASGHNEPDGLRTDFNIRGTALFRREGGAWKMIGLHTDLLPYLQP